MADIDANLPALLARATASLSIDASDAAKELVAKRLQGVAASLALEWITGESRFENQSQQTEYWLACIYEALFPDEQPDATRLYMRFGLPLPRAQYVSRLLLARRAAHWRDAARKEVQSALAEHEGAAKKAIKDSAGSTTTYKISLSRGAYDELIVMYDRMAAQLKVKDRPSPPPREPSSPKLVWFKTNAKGLVALLAYIRGDKA